MFTKGFDKYICDGDKITCTVDGFKVTARVERNPDTGPPWKEHDGHGDVSEFTTRNKKPGERVLTSDGGGKRYYDFAGAVRKALAERWDAPPYKTGTKHQQAARAAERDFAYLKAWCDDEWCWCGVVVTVSRNGVQLTDDYGTALWGIECNPPNSDNGYLLEVANELLDDALEAARAKLKELCACADEDQHHS